MATRTWRGTISSNWNVAGNWLEGAVPIAGDDVVFDSSSLNCQLTSNVPSTGQLRSFIVSNNCTATIDINGKILSLFSVGFDGVAFNAGSATWQDSVGNGYIYLYNRASATNPNYTRVVANNQTLSNVNFFMATNSTYLVLSSDMYCKDFVVPGNNYIFITPTTTVSYTLYINGNAYFSETYPGSASWGQLIGVQAFQNVVLTGNSNMYGSIHPRVAGTSIPFVKINGNYALTNNFGIYVGNNAAINATVEANGKLTAGNYQFHCIVTKSGNATFGIDLKLNETDTIYLSPSAYGGRIYMRDSYITNKLIIMSNSYYADNIQSAYGDNTKANITLANNASLLTINTGFKNIAFNKPVTAIGGSVTNCDNIKIIDFPCITKNVF